MQAREMTQQVIALQQRMVDNWDGAMALMEDQASASVNWMLDTATWLPEEGRQAVTRWMAIAKEERGRWKAHIDQQMSTVEKMFPSEKKPTPVKPQKSTVTKKKETPNESV